MDVFLVRHGEAAASWSQSRDPGLSELGVEQACQAAQQLAQQVSPGTQLLSSPLARARETALPLARTLEQPVAINDAFREIPSPVPLDQRQDWLRAFMRQRWETQPEELQQWRAAAYRQLLALSEPTVVYTHFLLINAMVGRVTEQAETLCFWPDNASITRLRHLGDSLELGELGRELDTVVN